MDDHPESDRLDAILALLIAGDHEAADAVAQMEPDELDALLDAGAGAVTEPPPPPAPAQSGS